MSGTMIEIKTPTMGESISEAVVAKWLKKAGEAVQADELLAELETDKVNLEVSAPEAGVLAEIVAPAGSTVKVGQLLAKLQPGAAAAPKVETKAVATGTPAVSGRTEALEKSGPAVRKLAAEQGVSGEGLVGSGKDGRLTKQDVLAQTSVVAAPGPAAALTAAAQPMVAQIVRATGAREERVPMTRIRKTIATRLKQAQNTAAMLTTYNEVDLLRVNTLRKEYKEAFEKQHGAKLGYMGFFSKAVVEALQAWPALNAEISGDDIVYKQHYDLGVAVSSERGLVVPVVRDANLKSLADIEREIADFGARARSGGLKPDELVGATFSITNGGTFGSLMSMPILNFPQVGILGMHAIKDRPVVVDGQIVIRPMMYIALTYDHRIVDGREAVSFLVRVKDCLEDPARLVLGV